MSEEKRVLIFDFPVPPSDNALKKPVRRYAKGGGSQVLSMVDSNEYLLYKREIQFWLHTHAVQAQEWSRKIQSWLDEGKGLDAQITYFISKSSLITKKNTTKKWDVMNRIKALMDSLTRVLSIDDKEYWSVSVKKVQIIDGLKEHVVISITPTAQLYAHGDIGEDTPR